MIVVWSKGDHNITGTGLPKQPQGASKLREILNVATLYVLETSLVFADELAHRLFISVQFRAR